MGEATRAHMEHRLAGMIAEWVRARDAKREDVKAHNETISALEEMIEKLSAELVAGQFQATLPFDGDDGPRIFAAAPEEDEGAGTVNGSAGTVNGSAGTVNDEQQHTGEPCVACGGSRRDSTGGICRACDGHGVQGGAAGGVDPDPLGLSELDPKPEESLPGTVEEHGGGRGRPCSCGDFYVPANGPATTCLVCQGRATSAEMCVDCKTNRHAWGKTRCAVCANGGGAL